MNSEKTMAFNTRMQKAVYQNKNLATIIYNFPEIDYESEFYKDDITKSRKKQNVKYPDNEKESSKSDQNKFTVKNVQKYVILIEKLIELSTELGREIGVSDTYTYMYNGGYWEEVKHPILLCFLSEVAIKSGIHSADAKQKDEIEKMFKQFHITANIPQTEEQYGVIKINLKNGTFVIDKGLHRIEEPNCDDFFKYQLPFEYNPEAKAPLFHKYLDRVLPDNKSQMVLAEYIGYVFNRSLKLEKCLLIIGKGANGKSVFFDIIRAIFGTENIRHYSLKKLCEDNGYYRIKIANKLLNYSSELGAKDCPPDTVKKLISGEPIDARNPFGEATEIFNYARLIFNANTLPKETEQTEAYFRRFTIIRFKHTIPKEERDTFLAEKIIGAELSGIFNWIVDGLERVTQQKGFTHAPLVDEELTTYEEESNSVGLFMTELNYRSSTENTVKRSHLYEGYKQYCRENGYIAVGGPEFSRRLEDLGFKIRRKATNNATLVYCDNSVLDQQTVGIIQNLFNN